VLVVVLQDLILATFCTNSRRPFDRAVQSRGLEGIDTYNSIRLFVRILLKECFCVLYTRRDVVSLIWNYVEVLHLSIGMYFKLKFYVRYVFGLPTTL
jgi:hypothetical protein